jgi:phenylacetate-CoA ligase
MGTRVRLYYLPNIYEKNLLLKTICPSLKVAMVTSEMLLRSIKAAFETQFRSLLLMNYGASELI